ncbi:MAG: hypothetical protein J6N54_07225 [Bacteroidales bacterium]|nr:hypothetical protein [Bacteroidales bacterium]
MKKLLIMAAMMLPLVSLISSCGGGSKNLTDKEILALVYQKAGGDTWKDSDKENWNSEEDLGKWKNVKVNAEGRVTDLTVRGVGEIPAEISGLTELKNLVIVLRNDDLDPKKDDVIPASISQLSNLETLRLNVSGSNYTVPDLKSLSKIKTLYLNLPKTVQFPEVPVSLESLDISGGNGEIPASYYDLSNLKRISITTSGLKGGISPKVANLKKLEHLQIDQTAGLIGNVAAAEAVFPNEIYTMTNLKRIFLRKVSTSGTVPPEVANMKNLESLIIADCGLTGELPKELGQLTGLKTLEIYDNKITGTIPAEIGDMTALKELWLQRNQLTGTIPASLGKLANLEGLQLSKNQLTGKIPAELAACKNLGKGPFVDFSGNNLDPVPEALKALEKFSKFKF